MRVSVVVPTYKRPQSLARCLDALERQQHPAQEILVAVRVQDTASQEVVRARAQPVQLVLVDRPGVVAAMNAGIDASHGDLVAFTDDDAAPHPDWLAQMVAVYAGDEHARVAAVGGRDWVHTKQGRLIDDSAHTVGTVSWFGRVTGNHHLGVGRARDVEVLKGVNLSVRGELLRELGIDERLRGAGTEHHWEVALCLALAGRGFRIVYDPAIAVDHHLQERVEDSRRFDASELRDSTFNETLALLEYLPAWRRASFLVWALAVGTSPTPGVAQMLRALPSSGAESWWQFIGAQAGLFAGVRAYRRSRRTRR
jgi:glycosyltransferase involved in cell wall biosynthesis